MTAHHKGTAPGFERPAVMPPHPADLAGDAHVWEVVRRGRLRGVSWAHLAKQTGRAEADLRRAYAPITDGVMR